MCRPHLDQEAFKARQERERRREAGLCMQCGRRPRKSGTRCEECVAGNKRRRQESRAAGLCTNCHRRPAADHALCERCRATERRKMARVQERFFQAGGCVKCGKTNANGKRHCDDCCRRRLAEAAELRAKRLCLGCREAVPGATVYCPVCLARYSALAKRRNDRLKASTFERYGGSRCVCCGVEDLVFLTIDHVNGGGTKHRKTSKLGGGAKFYRWLRLQGYPAGYQVLCFNCNFARHKLGVCPHQQQGAAREPVLPPAGRHAAGAGGRVGGADGA